jgi:hypothetical protein
MLFYKIRNRDYQSNILFDGDDELFKEALLNIKTYGEYGCGKSTNWVLRNTSANVIAVDTSEKWVEAVQSKNIESNKKLNIHYSNLGPVGAWGRPIDYSESKYFSDYTDYLWTQADQPNVILIDGRFRVCCFLTSLKFANEGVQIIFDDYTERPYYHFVEKYIPRIRECGRQCLFIVPAKTEIDLEELDRDINAFRNVMD